MQIKLPANKITLELTEVSAASQGEEKNSTQLQSASGLHFSLINLTKEKQITNFTVQYPYIILDEGEAGENDELQISAIDEKGQMTAEAVTFTLDEQRMSVCKMVFLENGKFSLDGTSGSDSNIVMVFEKSTGKFIDSAIVSSFYSSDPLPEGEYLLVFIKKTDLFRNVSNFSKLAEFGLVADTDYVVRTIQINNGEVIDLGVVSVPILDESKLYYTIAENTKFTSNVTSPQVGRYIVMRCEYKIDPKYSTEDQFITIELPDGIEFVNASLTFNGKQKTCTVDADTILIHTNQSEGVLRFYIVSTLAEKINLNAYLSFRYNGSDIKQPIGTATFTAEADKIIAPEKTSQKTITVTGTTMPNSTVTVYDNNVEVGTTTSNAMGRWSLSFDLIKPYSYSYHKINAKIQNKLIQEDIFTADQWVNYDQNYTEVSKLTMINTAHDSRTREFVTEFDFLNPKNTVPSYNYWPYYPTFTFKVEFVGDHTYISDVYVITTNQAGDETYILLTYDEASCLWIGTHDYITGAEIPAKVNVAYNYSFTGDIVMDRELIADINMIFDDVSQETEENLNQQEDFTDVVDESLSLEELTYLIYEEYDEIIYKANDIIENFENDLATELKESNIELTNSQNGFDLLIDLFESDLNISTCDNITVEELLNDGFETVDMSDGSKIYYKTTDGKCVFVDPIQNLYFETTFNELVATSDTKRSLSAKKGKSGFNAQVMVDAFDKVSAAAQALYDMYECAKRLIDKWINKLDLEFKAQKDLLAKATANKEYWKIKSKNAGSLSDDYQLIALEYLKKERDAKKAIESLTNQMNLLKGLRAATNALNVVGIITSVLSLRKYIAELKGLYYSVPDPCENDYEKAEQIRKDIQTLAYYVAAFYILDISGSIISMTSLFVASFATISGGPVGMAAAAVVFAGLIASIFVFDKAMQAHYKEIERRIRELKCKTDDDPPQPQNPPPAPPSGSGQDVTGNIDPSGYVYEAVPSNRLEGVKVEAYVYDYAYDEFGMPSDTKTDILWNAEEYDQVNPLYTDAAGGYAWDVPLGQWLVKFSKEGYYDTDSRNLSMVDEDGYLPVPPPQTEVNVGMVSKSAPTLKEVNIYDHEIRLVFSQYMQLDSVNANTITVTIGGKAIKGTITPINAEYDYEQLHQYASKFVFIPESTLSDMVSVTAANAINYAGTKMTSSVTKSGVVVVKPQSIVANDEISVTYNSGALLDVAVLPDNIGAGVAIDVISASPSIVTVVNAHSVTDENGHVNVMLTGNLPGKGEITISIPGTDIIKTVKVTVSDISKPKEQCEKVKADIPSGSILEVGSKLTLTTQTEGAEIYYTLDGTCPCTIDSPSRIKYTEPITITEDMFLIAYAVKEGIEDSYTAGFIYSVATPYTITYNLNGGKNHSANPDSYKITSNDIILNSPTKSGYTFRGWYLDPDFITPINVISSGSTGEKNLYAKWEKNYSITYKLNSGKNHADNPNSYTVSSQTITLKNATRKGYTFKGWYSDSKLTKKVTKIVTGSTGNKTLYAKWAKTYTITYKLNGGTNSKSNPKTYTKIDSTITLKKPTRKGYTFKGWYSDSKFKKKVTKISKGSTGNKTLYAKWAKNSYKITYKLNSGKNSTKNPKTYTVTTKTITLKNPTRKGYTFQGWYSDAKFTKKVTKITKGSTGNITLYAKWKKK